MSTSRSGTLAAVLAAAAVAAAGCGGNSQPSSGASARHTSATSTASHANAESTANHATGASTSSHATDAARAPVTGHPSAHRSARGGQLAGSSTAPRQAGAGVASALALGAGHGPAAVKAPKSPAIPTGPVVTGFSGTGSRAIGSLSEKTGVVIEWKAVSPPIQIFNSQGFMLVNSNLPSGRVRLSSGHYQGLHVGAKGPWTIQIHAAA